MHEVATQDQLGKLTGSLALSLFFARRIRQEAVDTLLAAMSGNQEYEAALRAVCRCHPEAAWWLTRKRPWLSNKLEYWIQVLGPEMQVWRLLQGGHDAE